MLDMDMPPSLDLLQWFPGLVTYLLAELVQAAKGMLAKNFDMEELWFAAVGGKLKVWSARSNPELKVSREGLIPIPCAHPYSAMCTHYAAGRWVPKKC
jgi:hypothetical protein